MEGRHWIPLGQHAASTHVMKGHVPKHPGGLSGTPTLYPCRDMRVQFGSALARRPSLLGDVWRQRIPRINACVAHAGMRTATQSRPTRVIRLGALGVVGGMGILTYSFLQWRFLQAPPKDPHEKEQETPSIPAPSPSPKPIVLRVWHAVSLYVIEPLLVCKRFILLALIFAPVVLATPLLFVGTVSTYKDQDGHLVESDRWGALLWYRLLVSQMEMAGPTFVKLGQWAGSRRDLFPDELCNRLSKLHSNNKPHSMAYTRRVLERVFQRPFDEVFATFDEKPVGIGAVGQVYKAVLHQHLLPLDYVEDTNDQNRLHVAAENIGRELALTFEHDQSTHQHGAAVAIKILHPNVHRIIHHDIKIMQFFAGLLNALPGMRWISLPEEVEQFAQLMVSQLDLRQEASHLSRFERNFAGRGGTVVFPRPLHAFCSQDVLVEELIEAVPLKHFMHMGSGAYDSHIAEMGLDAFLSMLLIDNFTHADLHPGNIMVKFYRPSMRSLLQNILSRILYRFDPDYVLGHRNRTGIIPDDQVAQKLVSCSQHPDDWHAMIYNIQEDGFLPELVILDAGLISELSPKNLQNFMDLFAAIATLNGRQAGALMVERCRTPELVTDKEGFVNAMEGIISNVASGGFSLAALDIGHVLNKALKAVRKYHVKMEPDFVNTVLSIMILEGIGRRLDPDLDLFRNAIPILRSLGHKMSSDEAQLATLRDQMSVSTLFPMLKLWFFMECRSLFLAPQNAPQIVDAFIRYGWLSE